MTTAASPTLAAAEPKDIFAAAERLLEQKNDPEAAKTYEKALASPALAPLAHFRLGEIENRAGRVEKALAHHRAALLKDPGIAGRILKADMPHHRYVYHPVEEVQVTSCPACGSEGRALHGVYNCLADPSFLPGFDPIKCWVRCTDCEMLYASGYPANLRQILLASVPGGRLEAKPGRFATLGRTVAELLPHTQHRTMLDVGTGAGELPAVAAEMGLEVQGVDIRKPYAEAVRRRFGFPVEAVDFLEYAPDKKFGIITLGDVLEHFPNPGVVIEKAVSLLAEGGVLWISTPNYQSAFTKTLATFDPMWRVCQHLTYFCGAAIEALLEKYGLEIVRYLPSPIYNGSMELTIARKA